MTTLLKFLIFSIGSLYVLLKHYYDSTNDGNICRMYGTSEYQITEALYQLMQEKYIKREDFIFQTKLVPAKTKSFAKSWDATWANVGDKLGYIDLLGVHAVADNDEKLEETMKFLKEVKKQGKIKHIGFSTHGNSEQIMDLINTEQVRDNLAMFCTRRLATAIGPFSLKLYCHSIVRLRQYS